MLDALVNRRFEPFDRSVDVMVGKLRRKIELDSKQPRLIVTVPGEGYRFDGLAKSSLSGHGLTMAVPSPGNDELSREDALSEAQPEQRPERDLPEGGAQQAPQAAIDQTKSLAYKLRGFVLLGLVVAALLFLAAASGWFVLAGKGPKTEAARLSIVVLPFVNLSGDAAQDYLVDALTDELTTNLARMSGTISGTFVIARNTAFTYKGKQIDAKAIGSDLGVRYVLEGSVQPSDDRMRVNAQLIDAGSGAHLWAEQFDTTRADLLQTQDEIVIHLARAMELQLVSAEAARLKRTPAANPDAEDLALQGFAAVQKGGFVGREADAGYALCEQALRVDPDNVRALWVLSMKFHVPVLFGLSADPKADLKRADALVSQALALDPANAAAHNAKAWVLYEQGRSEEVPREIAEEAACAAHARVANAAKIRVTREIFKDAAGNAAYRRQPRPEPHYPSPIEVDNIALRREISRLRQDQLSAQELSAQAADRLEAEISELRAAKAESDRERAGLDAAFQRIRHKLERKSIKYKMRRVLRLLNRAPAFGV